MSVLVQEEQRRWIARSLIRVIIRMKTDEVRRRGKANKRSRSYASAVKNEGVRVIAEEERGEDLRDVGGQEEAG